jgi:hypothetical protein
LGQLVTWNRKRRPEEILFSSTVLFQSSGGAVVVTLSTNNTQKASGCTPGWLPSIFTEGPCDLQFFQTKVGKENRLPISTFYNYLQLKQRCLIKGKSINPPINRLFTKPDEGLELRFYTHTVIV